VKAQDPKNEELSVLMLGHKGSGCTSLAYSMLAARTGSYPKRFEKKAGREPDVLFTSLGTNPFMAGDVRHVIPPRNSGELPIVLTEVDSSGTASQVRLPGGRRLPVALRSHSLTHDSVLLVLDTSERPLWEDVTRAEELGQLCATLRQQRYTVVFALTKLYKVREDLLKDMRMRGVDCHGGVPGRDPRRSYEEFVSRYIEKTIVALQATPPLKKWHSMQEPGTPSFPKAGSTIFDTPTWTCRREYEDWQERRGTPELPNLRYVEAQLDKLSTALFVQPPMPAGIPWYQLTDDDNYQGPGREITF